MQLLISVSLLTELVKIYITRAPSTIYLKNVYLINFSLLQILKKSVFNSNYLIGMKNDCKKYFTVVFQLDLDDLHFHSHSEKLEKWQDKEQMI